MIIFSTNFFRTTFLGAMLCFSLVRPALSASATELSCGLVSSFLDNRSGALTAFREIMSTMDDAKFGEVAPFFATLPEDFASGKVAEIANIGDLYIEHFIVLNSPELGNVYFRVIYEAGSDTMIGVKFDINTAAEKVLGSWPVFQKPVLQQC